MYYTNLPVLVLMVATYVKGESVITCDAPAVTEGEPASITCNFNEDVSQTRKQFLVKRRLYWAKFDPDSMETVMSCYWTDTQTDVQCNSAKGFTLGQLGWKATIDIPRANQSLIGNYTCEVVPSDPEDIQSCEFRLKERTVDGTRANKLLNNQNIQVEVDAVKGGVFAGVAICTLILIILVGALLLVFMKRLKTLCSICPSTAFDRHSSKQAGKEESTEMLSEHSNTRSVNINVPSGSNAVSREDSADCSSAGELKGIKNPTETAKQDRKRRHLSVREWRKREEIKIKWQAEEMEAEERLELAEQELREFTDKNGDHSCYIGRRKQSNVHNAQSKLADVKKKNENKRIRLLEEEDKKRLQEDVKSSSL